MLGAFLLIIKLITEKMGPFQEAACADFSFNDQQFGNACNEGFGKDAGLSQLALHRLNPAEAKGAVPYEKEKTHGFLSLELLFL